MNKISDITRRDILDIIKNGFVEGFEEPVYNSETEEYITEKKIFMPFFGRLDEIDFFTRLYDLEALPSYDNRYKDALGDISCHLSWGDYEDCWFFKDRRFRLMQSDGDEPLLKFICEMLHPTVRNEKSPWKLYLEKFNELLRADGYELYAAQHISGRDIYKAKEYVASDAPLLPDNLFSVRYKALIECGNGVSIDNISGMVDFATKRHLCKIMLEFAEPMKIQRSRYDNWTDNTDALKEAINRFNEFMELRIIDLNVAMFFPVPLEELSACQFTPFLFDIVEFQFDELSNGEKTPFQSAINASLTKDNVPFRLSDRGLIEILNDHEVLSAEIIKSVDSVSEPGIHDLLNEAITKHMQPTFQAHRDAVEKIWDALERLKTYYTTMDKKASATRIENDMAGGRVEFISLFDAEFKALTDIGNNFRIRHHEINKVDITDMRHFDYLFNRCLSLIAASILYLQ